MCIHGSNRAYGNLESLTIPDANIVVSKYINMSSLIEFLDEGSKPGPDRLIPGCILLVANKDGMPEDVY